MQEQSRLSFFLTLCLSPPPPLFAVFLSPSTRRPSVRSFALQVVALRLAPLPAIQAGQRLPVFVHAPAVSPPPAFGWTALQRKKKIFFLVVQKLLACFLPNQFAMQRLTCAAFSEEDCADRWHQQGTDEHTNISQPAPTSSFSSKSGGKDGKVAGRLITLRHIVKTD